MHAATVRPCTAPENDAEMWFADANSSQQREAVRLCGECPFRADCAADGMREEFGVWGGITPEHPARAKAIRARNRERMLAMRRVVIDLTNDGLSKAEISERTGLSARTVARARAAA